MQPTLLETLTNVLAFVFWFKLWNRQGRDLAFNRFLAPLDHAGDQLVGFFRSVFAGAPPAVIAAALLVFVLALRGLLIAPGSTRTVLFGFLGGEVAAHRLVDCLALTLLSFGKFLFALWGLTLIYARDERRATEQTTQAVAALARPFSALRLELRPLALLAAGMALAYLTASLAAGAPLALPPVPILSRLAVSALMAWVNLLQVIITLITLMIIGSWVAMFTRSGGLMFFCQEWLGLLLGRFRVVRLQLGPVDLTPIVAILAIQAIYWGLGMALVFVNRAIG